MQSDLLFSSYFIYLLLGPLLPDGCKLSVLLTFSYVDEILGIFPALKYNYVFP